MGTPSHSYGTTLAIWDHSVTCHPTQVNAPRLTPAMQAGTRFTYPAGMEGWVDLSDKNDWRLRTKGQLANPESGC